MNKKKRQDYMKEYNRKWREKNKDYYKIYYKENKENEVKRKKEWREENPLKHREHNKKCYHKNGRTWRKASREYNQIIRKTRTAVANGAVDKKEHCENCGHDGSIYRLEKHHPDYSDPLKIIWLCSKCHKNLHAGNIKL